MSNMRRLIMMFTRPTDGGGDDPTPVLPYDAQVEYLESDGNQYIDLLFTGSEATDAYEATFQQTTSRNGHRIVSPSTTSTCQIYVNGSLSFGYTVNGSWKAAIPNNAILVGTDKHTWKIDYVNKKNTIDGIDYTFTTSSSKNSGTNHILLIGKWGTNNQYIGKIYSFKFWRSGVLQMDLIPVRVGQVGYMYDNVSGNLFGNSGTGSFTYGNDVTT